MVDILAKNEILETFKIDVINLVDENLISSIICGGVSLNKFQFILTIVCDCSSGDRFVPNPILYLSDYFDEGELTQSDINKFMEDVKSSTFNNILQRTLITNNGTDHEFVEELMEHETSFSCSIGKFVPLLYFFISSSKFSSIPFIETDQVGFYTLDNDVEKIQEFANIPGDKKMVFHGTNAYNMYSITRNGLKSMSGSSYMSTGSAYGNGIYCTTEFNMAFGYASTYNYGSRHTILKSSEYQYVLVLLIKRPNKKGPEIYVQKNEDVMVCGVVRIKCQNGRYLSSIEKNKIVHNCNRLIDGITNLEEFERIARLRADEAEMKYNMSNLKVSDDPDLEEENDSKEDLIHFPMTDSPQNSETLLNKKRFTKEMKMILDFKSLEAEDDTIKMIKQVNFNKQKSDGTPDYTSPLLIKFVPPDDTPLYADMQEKSIEGIVLGVHFPSDYPISPPIVRVVYPHFKPHTGRVTSGGSICADILYSGVGWSPAMTLTRVIITIMSILPNEGQATQGEHVDSRGRLSETGNIHQPYTYTEYLSGYQIAKNFHKW